MHPHNRVREPIKSSEGITSIRGLVKPAYNERRPIAWHRVYRGCIRCQYSQHNHLLIFDSALPNIKLLVKVLIFQSASKNFLRRCIYQLSLLRLFPLRPLSEPPPAMVITPTSRNITAWAARKALSPMLPRKSSLKLLPSMASSSISRNRSTPPSTLMWQPISSTTLLSRSHVSLTRVHDIQSSILPLVPRKVDIDFSGVSYFLDPKCKNLGSLSCRVPGNGIVLATKTLKSLLATSTIEIQNVFVGSNATGSDFSVTYFKGISAVQGAAAISDNWRMIGTCMVEHWDVVMGVFNSSNPVAYF